MAVTQAASDKKALGRTAHSDGQNSSVAGYFYRNWGPVRLYFGTGTPHGVIGASTNLVPLGSLFIRRDNGYIYSKITSETGTAWE